MLQLEIPGMEECLNIASSIEVSPGRRAKRWPAKKRPLPCLLWVWH